MPVAQPRKVFVNLPVKQLDKTKAFFAGLGFEFNAQFTDDNAAAMVLSDDGYVMLLTEEFFSTFTAHKVICDTTTHVEALVALSADSRQAVDDLVDAAVAAGGREFREAQDHGFMYGRAFEDLDGHVWEIFWMDPAHIQAQ